MARLQDVVFDCRHPASLARFWAAALDGYAVAPYDDEELARQRSIGVEDPEDDPTVVVAGPEGAPQLWFQRVPEPKVVKNRVHLDVRCGDGDGGLDAEVARLVALGAVLVTPGASLAVLQDPEGNEFCVVS